MPFHILETLKSPQFYRKYFHFFLGIAFVFIVYMSWSNRFIQDDAFISFRYADHLANGLGLVWNPGERIEGYTNFLWTCMMSGVIYAGGNPVFWSQIFGLFFFCCSIGFMFKLSKLIFQSDMVALIAVLFLGTNYTFSCYATGGLETQMQAAFFLASSYICLRNIISKSWSLKSIATFSLLLAGSLLIRLDSAILVAILGSISFYFIWNEKIAHPVKRKKISILIFPLILCVAPWFVWKLSYYGSILPNTFYAKVGSQTSILRGLGYVYEFIASYLLLPFILIAVVSARRLMKKQNMALLILVSIIAGWLLYVVKVGGDFMEFRFFVSILPFIFILITWLIFYNIEQVAIRWLLVAFVFLGSWYHATTFAYSPTYDIESIQRLSDHLYSKDENWVKIGKILGKVFDQNRDVTIAVTAAGAIPYYSKLKTIDMDGINDPWVGKHGVFFGSRPGHQHLATLRYLNERGVNLIISHPIVMDQSTPVTVIPAVITDQENTVRGKRIIVIPISETKKLIVIYLKQHPAIDEVLDKYGWQKFAILE